ncbi:YceI family protein [Myxococcota bacterium]|nr:YceI family protein [Myxococcota bacterium]MBU1432317.1 YceI family protein [Myxococcota bacterium]MBU1897567.1 YceI family protein [Myxococcota bacterium]
MRHTYTLTSAFFALMITSAMATTFKLSPGPINRVTFDNDAPFETITGFTGDVTGSIDLDLSKPSGAKGEVTIPVKSLNTGVALRDEHLRSDKWFDEAAHPNMTFKLSALEVKGSLKAGKPLKGKLKGVITIKGVSKAISVPVKVAYRASDEQLKAAYIKGDVLRLKAEFTLNIRDFGIIPPAHVAGIKVADEVTIKVGLTALSEG